MKRVNWQFSLLNAEHLFSYATVDNEYLNSLNSREQRACTTFGSFHVSDWAINEQMRKINRQIFHFFLRKSFQLVRKILKQNVS
jgi:hypothetical protein